MRNAGSRISARVSPPKNRPRMQRPTPMPVLRTVHEVVGPRQPETLIGPATRQSPTASRQHSTMSEICRVA